MLVAITFENFGLTEPAPLSVLTLLINIIFGASSAYLLSWHYVRYGKTNSNRAEFAQVFPIISMTTVLIISVVKASLALSLGLVGALSIVRFRTPIKEPEELGYLFIAISIGLGFGADQRLSTLIALILILGILALVRRVPGALQPAKHTLYCNIEVPAQRRDDAVLKQVHDLLATQATLIDMRRVDVRDGLMHATYLINCSNNQSLLNLMEKLQGSLPEASISFVDQKGPMGL